MNASSARSVVGTALAVLALALVATPLVHCATLTPIPADTCGNGVLEPAKEDCEAVDGGPACGAPDTSGKACRLLCSRDGTTACPSGWGCGTNRVCAEPTGIFEDPSDRVESGILDVQIGDFDGDGHDDVLGTAERGADNSTRSKVLFFGDRGQVAEVLAFPAPLAGPVVRDVDGNGRADLVYGLTGVNVSLGQSDRSFRSVLFPSATFPGVSGALPLSVFTTTAADLPTGEKHARLYFAKVERNGRTVDALTDFATFSVELPSPVSAIVGRPVWAPLSDAPTSTCGEVVFAVATPPSIVVVSPCQPGGERLRWATERGPKVYPLPGPPTGGVVLADIDVRPSLVNGVRPPRRPGQTDILVPGLDDGRATTWSLRNTGVSFEAASPAVEPRRSGAPPLFDREGVLAAGDLNADGFPDFILPVGVKYSVHLDATGDEAKYVFVASNRSLRWSQAFVGRLNADPYPDYVAASAESADLEFGAGTGGIGAVASTIFTPGVVGELGVGDFDGDGVGDVVLTSVGADETSSLSIAFGAAIGPPQAARVVGRVGAGSKLDVGVSFAGMNDVLLTTEVTKGTAKDTQVALLVPSGDRQLVAPLLFLPPNQDPNIGAFRPHTTLLAPFVTPGQNDVLAFAVGVRTLGSLVEKPPVSLWFGRNAGPESFEKLSREVESVQLVGRTRDDRPLFYATTADLDQGRSDVEEVIVLTALVGGATIGVGRKAVATTPMEFQGFRLMGWDVTAKSALSVVDVDGDGARDVLLVLTKDRQERAVVVWGDGRGGFDVGSPLELVVPPKGDAKDLSVTGVTTLLTGPAAGGAPRRELVVSTSKRLLRAPIGAGRALPPLTELADKLEDLTSIAAGDVDGDGLPDLVVAERGGIRVLRQKARIE